MIEETVVVLVYAVVEAGMTGRTFGFGLLAFFGAGGGGGTSSLKYHDSRNTPSSSPPAAMALKTDGPLM